MKTVRDALKAEVCMCEVCLRKRDPEQLAGHEIANGPLRQKCLDLRFALLVVCREPIWRTREECHRTVQNEPEARQLARLWLSRDYDFDLAAYNNLVNPRAPERITQDEVDVEIELLLNQRSTNRD